MTVTAVLREARRQFLGSDDLHLMRDWLAGRLTASGLSNPNLTARAVFMANELAGNAIKHTVSGHPGGTYSVGFRWSANFLMVSVADQGGSGTVPTAAVLGDLDPMAESGRGLALIAADAALWGHGPTPGGGRRVWARIAR